MFHLVLTACLAQDPAACNQVLLPAGDAVDRSACMSDAEAVARPWLAARPDLIGQSPECLPTDALPALAVREIAPGVFFHQGIEGQIAADNAGRIANLSFVVGDTVAVIDAGASRAQGQALYAAIRRITDKPVSHLVLTHMHPDHSLGAEVFVEAGARVIGHPQLPMALDSRAATYLANFVRIVGAAQMIGTGMVAPEPIPGATEIDLGTTALRLVPVATAHTDNDLTVFDSASGTLFTGDLVFRGLTPVVDGSLIGWLGWMARPPEPAPARIVPGHGPLAATWAEATEAQALFLTALRDATRAAIAEGLPMSTAVPAITGALEPLAPGWTAFDQNAPRDATAAYKELEWE